MASKRILFNFASRSRPKRFNNAVLNIYENCVDKNFNICAKFDSDDPFLFAYNNVEDSAIRVGKSESKVHAVNRDIPKEGWDILINMSDDIVWTVKGFDNIIRECCGPDDFCLFPEPYADSQHVKGKNERIAVVSIMGIDYYNRDGYIYHPSYKRTHCDNEAVAVAEQRGRLKIVEATLYYHEHPAAGYKVKDDQYLLERKTWAEDKENFRRRKEAGFPK